MGLQIVNYEVQTSLLVFMGTYSWPASRQRVHAKRFGSACILRLRLILTGGAYTGRFAQRPLECPGCPHQSCAG